MRFIAAFIFSLINKRLQCFHHVIDHLLVLYKIVISINHQNLLFIIVFKPFFMFLMYHT